MITRKSNETALAFAIRQLRWGILTHVQAIVVMEDIDVSAISEDHKIGYKAGYRQTMKEVNQQIETVKWEGNDV